ncbi:MAG: tRNA (adenosine(37)-N6)-threonylcarbamoyltransferase complex ATPase subunit type 1 TsaE [Oscillospiraceae bacterium]|jgi:tRNA threonylcarbamoyladenosine biosynthesis protein TsaE|nr:tRNA (adenosine(37)-N6)-threonylcarbamoyltransferase complex ATPase subunit type 1 TsaE [Oscillospiraceae bacterium]
MNVITHSERETEDAGRAFGKTLRSGDIVALRGGLGAGKTAFTRGIAAALGICARVTSPTFTIVNEYDGAPPLFHFDMYRLTSGDDLFELGWDEYLTRGGVSVVEWSERITDFLPEGARIVEIIRTGDDTRRIEIGA